MHVCDVRMRVWVYAGDGGQGLTDGEGGLTCNSTQLWRDQRLRADANGARWPGGAPSMQQRAFVWRVRVFARRRGRVGARAHGHGCAHKPSVKQTRARPHTHARTDRGVEEGHGRYVGCRLEGEMWRLRRQGG